MGQIEFTYSDHLFRMLFFQSAHLLHVLQSKEKMHLRLFWLCLDRQIRFFPAGGVDDHLHIVVAGGERYQIRTDTVSAHPGTDLNHPYMSLRRNLELSVGRAVCDLQCVQSPSHHIVNLICHIIGQIPWLHMACLNKMRFPGGILFCDCQILVFSAIGDRFVTVFFSVVQV